MVIIPLKNQTVQSNTVAVWQRYTTGIKMSNKIQRN